MLKVKRMRTADYVVGGFRYESGRKLVGSLVLGMTTRVFSITSAPAMIFPRSFAVLGESTSFSELQAESPPAHRPRGAG